MRIPEVGELLQGKYRIESVLGEGGFGRVVRATTLETGRPVAVKFLKPKRDGYGTQQVQRFLREMRATAKLQCPSTLTLYDYGRTDDGLLYMVCEYIEGEDLLERVVTHERLPEHEVVWILYQVLQSLAEAHDAGLLHRDIKPANIRLFEYGNDPLRVKVLDFGLAKSLEPGEARLTGTGKVIGTPRYMSPDHLVGLELTPASDIFSLGVVALEMLLGRNATALFAGRRKLEVNPEDGVSSEIAGVVNRMLVADPDARYQSASDVLHDLRPLRGHRVQHPVRPRQQAESPPQPAPELAPTIEQTQRPTQVLADEERSNNRLLTVAVALGVLVAVGLAAASLLTQTAPEPVKSTQRQDVPFVQTAAEPDESKPDRPDVVHEPQQPSACGSLRGPGWMKVGDHETLRWKVYVPPSYTGEHEVPVVLLLAEALNSRPEFLIESGFVDLADREGFVVAAPILSDATRVRDWDDLVSAVHVRAFVEELRTEVCVTDDRVYLYGDGQGARKVRWLGCEPWVAAVVTHHDRPKNLDCADRQVPHLHVSPLDSPFIRLDGVRQCTNLIGDTTPIERFDTWWRKRNGCRRSFEEVQWNATLTCHEYEDCDEPFISCRTPGGFGWPNSQVRWMHLAFCDDEPKPADFAAPEVAWKFFTSAAPPEPIPSWTTGCGKALTERGELSFSVHDGLQRRTSSVYVPTSYDPSRSHPSMILLHRDAQTAKQLLRWTEFASLADERGFVILLPNHPNGMFAWREDSDIDGLQQMYDDVGDHLCLDEGRTFVVSHGSGGHAARRLACEPWIHGIAMNSFREESRQLPCPRPRPSIHLSPMLSKRLRVEGGSDPGCLFSDRPLPLDHHEQLWKAASGCPGPHRLNKHPGGSCFSHENCGVPFVSCRLDGGYGWPGGPPVPDPSNQCSEKPNDFEAERVIWDFFEGLAP